MSVRSLRYNTLNRHVPKSRLASTDRDALAFLEAAQVYDRNQQKAIVDLVRRLKSAGLWTKMKAIYPFIGGTASSHKWNLKDPLDSDAAFRLTFSGGWTHSSTGALPNGANTKADTFLIPNTMLSINNTHLSYYSRTDTAAGMKNEFGRSTSPANELPLFTMQLKRLSGSTASLFSDLYDYDKTRLITGNSDSRGYYTTNRTSTTVHNAFKNGTKLATVTTTATQTTMPTKSLILAAYTQDLSPTVESTLFYSDRECAFATIGDGLTDTDATNLYDIVDLYQKRLGRAV